MGLRSGAVGAPTLAPFFQATLAALQPDQPLFLRFCAVRALSAYTRGPAATHLSTAVSVLLAPVLALLPEGGEEGEILVLELLSRLLPLDLEATADAEPNLTPTLLALWSSRVEDPLLVSAVGEYL